MRKAGSVGANLAGLTIAGSNTSKAVVTLMAVCRPHWLAGRTNAQAREPPCHPAGHRQWIATADFLPASDSTVRPGT